MIRRIFRLPNDDPRKIAAVALTVCFVCSLIISTVAVVLAPIQQANKALDRKRTILQVAGLWQEDADIDVMFEQIEIRIVDLRAGTLTDAVDPETYDPQAAAREPSMSIAIPKDRDIATLARRPLYMPVYMVKDADRIEQIILPVHGYGLWSTMYAFLALEANLNTVSGIRFFEHGETPGLGGEVENPRWQRQWEGKLVYDADGSVRLRVIKGIVNDTDPFAEHQVDGLSGATLTTNGVTNLIRYWLGPDAYGPYLANLREKGV